MVLEGYYTLAPDGKTPVPCHDPEEWSRKYHGTSRTVGRTSYGEVLVSTVFLGLDHAWGLGPPILFETLVFNGEHDGDMDRYHTYDEAVLGHAKMVEKVQGKTFPDPPPLLPPEAP